MAWRLGDEGAIAREWQQARPFPHIVVDDAVANLAPIFAALDEEPAAPYEADLFVFEATAPEPATAELRAVRDGFASALAPVLSRVTGRAVSRADMRGYAYRAGHYLLPHSDHREGLARSLAYAYYVPSPEPPAGGELELFDGFTSATLIEPRGNRLVVFEVSDRSLHQVREVLAGVRLSLAGWFYP